jgi:hypothetical protein
VATFGKYRPQESPANGHIEVDAVGICRHHHLRRGLYRPHLTDSDRGSNERDRRSCGSFLHFNGCAVDAVATFPSFT